MKYVLIYIVCQVFNLCGKAQTDTLSISLIPFTKKVGASEWLYLSVQIRSGIRDSIIIDDTQWWMTCIDIIGVHLVEERLEGNCFTPTGSDCDPLVEIVNGEPTLRMNTKKHMMEGFGSYSYEVRIMPVYRVEESGAGRTMINRNLYRFKLELPYRCGDHTGMARSKNWTYFVYKP